MCGCVSVSVCVCAYDVSDIAFLGECTLLFKLIVFLHLLRLINMS